jgi:hypothetical protein
LISNCFWWTILMQSYCHKVYSYTFKQIEKICKEYVWIQIVVTWKLHCLFCVKRGWKSTHTRMQNREKHNVGLTCWFVSLINLNNNSYLSITSNFDQSIRKQRSCPPVGWGKTLVRHVRDRFFIKTDMGLVYHNLYYMNSSQKVLRNSSSI